jgi:hypothetical protein
MATDLTEARERMVVEQLEQRGIKDARVAAILSSSALALLSACPL